MLIDIGGARDVHKPRHVGRLRDRGDRGKGGGGVSDAPASIRRVRDRGG